LKRIESSPTTHWAGKTMATQTKMNARESMQDFLMVSSFGFWAMMLGFVPVATFHFFAS
jgi:hypothetical protein